MLISRNFRESNAMLNQFFNFQKVSNFFRETMYTSSKTEIYFDDIFAEIKLGQDLFTRYFFRGLRHIIHKSRVSLSCVIYLSV